MITLTITIREITPLHAQASGTIVYHPEITASEVAELARFDAVEWKAGMYKIVQGIHQRRKQSKRV
jgi:hypothetical protein